MTTFDIDTNESVSADEIRTAVEELCIAWGLEATSTGTLKSCPGSVHWHFKKGKERGVLEITLWPKKNRLWLSTRPGRDAEWVFDALNDIGNQLKARYDAANSDGQ